eukprot:1159009-Pelagomonas_calceolata.AAC.3
MCRHLVRASGQAGAELPAQRLTHLKLARILADMRMCALNVQAPRLCKWTGSHKAARSAADPFDIGMHVGRFVHTCTNSHAPCARKLPARASGMADTEGATAMAGTTTGQEGVEGCPPLPPQTLTTVSGVAAAHKQGQAVEQAQRALASTVCSRNNSLPGPSASAYAATV